jgi:hypothetical protein
MENLTHFFTSAITLICLCFAFTMPVHAQNCSSLEFYNCNPSTINSNAIHVNGTLHVTGLGYKCYWVCNGDSLFIAGVGAEHSIWVEAGGYVQIDSILMASDFLVKDYGTVVFVGDTSIQSPPYNYVFLSSKAIISDPLGMASQIICNNVVFDYSKVSISGCDTSYVPTSTGPEIVNNANWTVSDFPSAWIISSVVPVGETEITIINLSGQKIYSFRETGQSTFTLDKATFVRGIYLAFIHTDRGSAVVKLIK